MAAGWNTKRNYDGNDNSQTPSYSNLSRHSFEEEVSESASQVLHGQIDRASKIKGINAPRNRPPIRDAFDSPFAAYQERSNSNGLSWSPKHAQNSVVDNMLLSLDNIRSQPNSLSSYETNNYTPTKERGTASHSTRLRSQTVSSVSSSEYSATHDTTPPHFSQHRSNSSANYQSTLGRIDSVRLTGQEEDPRPIHPRSSARNRGTGKDSGSSSLELERPEPRFKANRRSQSFDQGYLRMAVKNSPHDTFARGDSDATPSIPVNPRTQPLVAPLPSNVNGNLLSANNRRRGSDRSSIRPVLPPDNQPSNQQHAASRESGPATNTPERSISGPGYTPILIPKENQKPGFFRRMFGSTSGPSQRDEITLQKRNLQRITPSFSLAPPEDTADSRLSQSLQRTPMKDKSTKDQQQQLNKKTSFFRRRRKSVQESPVPQLPQVDTKKDEYTAGPDSPGSLQKVMDQYYASHKRMDSKGSIVTSRRKNSLQAGGMLSTIRAVGGPTAENNVAPSLVIAPRPSIDQESKPAKLNKENEHRRSLSNGSKLDSRETFKTLPNETSKHSPSHARTQSDVDKNLPKLPVDYTAVKSGITKEIPTSKYNNTAPKAATWESPAPHTPSVSASLTQSNQDSVDNGKAVAPYPRQDDKPEPAPEARVSRPEARATPTEDPAAESDELADETKEAMMFSVQNVDGPTQEQRDCARKLYDGTFGIDHSEVAPWLGEADPERSNIREAYMELFDWKDMSILSALRSFCSHIQVKGETQQVDRLLDALSRRWCDCNPKHGFKATGKIDCQTSQIANVDRCGSHNLLFCPPIEHRFAHGRH